MKTLHIAILGFMCVAVQRPLAAQATAGCDSFTLPSLNHIINPPPCLPNSTTPSPYAYSLYSFESQALIDFLSTHNQPSDPASISNFLNAATKDLRDEVRAFMLTELVSIINDPTQRPPGTWQSDLFSYMTAYIQQIELNTYKLAYNEYKKFEGNLCGYQVNSTLSAQYSIGPQTTNCNFLGSLFMKPQQLPAAYFIAVGTQQTYGTLLNKLPASAIGTYRGLPALLEAQVFLPSLAGSPAVGVAAAAAVATNFGKIAPFAARPYFQQALGAEAATDEVADEAEAGFVAADAGAGAFAIVTTAVLILVQGSIEFSQSVATQNGLDAMVAQYNNLNNPSYTLDLTALATDPNQTYKLAAVWTVLSANAVEGTAPAYRSSIDPVVGVTPGKFGAGGSSFGNGNSSDLEDYAQFFGASGPGPVYSNSFTNVDWEGRTWQVKLYGDIYFLKNCTAAGSIIDQTTGKTSNTPCEAVNPQVATTLETTLPTLNMTALNPNWSQGAEQLLVSRQGSQFYATDIPRTGAGGVSCPAQGVNGTSQYPYAIGSCGSFISNFAFFAQPYAAVTMGAPVPDPSVFPYSDVVVSQTPAFTSGNVFVFAPNSSSSYPVTATANGAPVFVFGGPSASCPSMSSLNPSNALPSGFGFQPGQSGMGVLYATGSVAAGNYPYTVCAQPLPSGPVVSQLIEIVVGTAPVFTSPTTFNVPYNTPFSFTISAKGMSTPAITIQNLDYNTSAQTTFKDNGDGTATLSGSISSSITYTCVNISNTCPVITGPPTITATSGLLSTRVPFAVNTYAAPPTTLYVPGTITMIAGVPNSIQISAKGQTRPNLSAASTNTVYPGGAVPAVDLSLTTPLSNESWLHFQDNGNGTATISGTPPQSVNTSFPLQVFSFLPSNTAPAIAIPTINVIAKPQFVNTRAYAILMQDLRTFDLAFVNNPTATADLTGFPAGSLLSTLDPSRAVLTLPSNLPASSGGHYVLPVALTNAAGTTTQNFDIYYVEPITLTLNTPGFATSFQVQQGVTYNLAFFASGYPIAKPLASAPAKLGSGLVFRTTNLPLPGSLTQTPSGAKLVLAPTTATRPGLYQFSPDATNGFPGNPPPVYRIQVVKAGDVNGDGAVDCADLTLVKSALNSSVGQAAYNIKADVNLDGLVNSKDYSFVALKLPSGLMCP